VRESGARACLVIVPRAYRVNPRGNNDIVSPGLRAPGWKLGYTGPILHAVRWSWYLISISSKYILQHSTFCFHRRTLNTIYQLDCKREPATRTKVRVPRMLFGNQGRSVRELISGQNSAAARKEGGGRRPRDACSYRI